MKTGDILEGRYRIISALDEGGMGIVFLAEHVLIKRRVALKVLRTELLEDADVIERFMNEARAAGTLGHPNIVESTDMGFTRDGVPYIVYEYLEGSLLTDEIYRVGGMPCRRAVRIARQIASALHAAHIAGIVHRDLKTDNVFLTHKEEAPDHVKVLDFGVSRFLEAEDDRSGKRAMVVGTPEFMAPEQIMTPEAVDGRADIYALGLILYEMVTARRPFRNEGDQEKLLDRIVHEHPPPLDLASAPAGLEEMIFSKLIAKDPAERYQTMKDVEGALEAFAGVLREGRESKPIPVASVTGEDPSPLTPQLAPQTTQPRRAWVGWLVGGVLLGAGGGGAMYTHRSQEATQLAAAAPDLGPLTAEAGKLGDELESQARAAHLRANGLAQTPMLRAGIETDAATLKDMARGDFLFTPAKGEVLELYKVADPEPVAMLRLPENAPAGKPLTGTQTRLDTDGKELRLTVSEPISKQGSADVGGAAVLTSTVDLEALRRRVGALVPNAKVEGLANPLILVEDPAAAAGGTPARIAVKVARDIHQGELFLSAVVPRPVAAKAQIPQTFKLASYGLWGLGGLLLVIYMVGLLRVRSQR